MTLPVIERTDTGWRLTWDTGGEVLEVDLRDDRLVEWWWRDRVANVSAGSEEPETGFSDELKRVANALAARAPGGEVE